MFIKAYLLIFVGCFFSECQSLDHVLIDVKKHKAEYYCIIETIVKSKYKLEENKLMSGDSLSFFSEAFCPSVKSSIKSLQDKNLLSSFLKDKNTPIFYSNSKCILLLIKRDKTTDYLLSYYANFDQMTCGIDKLYNVNQNEHISWLDISIRTVDSELNLIKITHAVDTGL